MLAWGACLAPYLRLSMNPAGPGAPGGHGVLLSACGFLLPQLGQEGSSLGQRPFVFFFVVGVSQPRDEFPFPSCAGGKCFSIPFVQNPGMPGAKR